MKHQNSLHYDSQYWFFDDYLNEVRFDSLEPNFAVQSLYGLYLHLPVKDGHIHTWSDENSYDGKCGYSIFVRTLKVEQKIDPYLGDSPESYHLKKYTIIEFSKYLEAEPDTASEAISGQQFLTILTDLISAINLTGHIRRVRKIEIGDLFPRIRQRTVQINPFKELDYLNTGFQLGTSPHELENEINDSPALNDMFDMIRKNENPYHSVLEKLRESYGFLEEKKYQQAIIRVQTGIEVLFQNLLAHFMEKEGEDNEDIKSTIEGLAIKSIIRAKMHSRLGGYWDLTNPETEACKWYNAIYKLRNKIVHRDYYPNYLEVELALEQARSLFTYLTERILANRSKYPELARYFEFNRDSA